jgi:hypothetical protein
LISDKKSINCIEIFSYIWRTIMPDQNPAEEIKSAAAILANWPGEDHHPNGAPKERRVLANGLPWMATYDKSGKCTGFGYV